MRIEVNKILINHLLTKQNLVDSSSSNLNRNSGSFVFHQKYVRLTQFPLRGCKLSNGAYIKQQAKLMRPRSINRCERTRRQVLKKLITRSTKTEGKDTAGTARWEQPSSFFYRLPGARQEATRGPSRCPLCRSLRCSLRAPSRFYSPEQEVLRTTVPSNQSIGRAAGSERYLAQASPSVNR